MQSDAIDGQHSPDKPQQCGRPRQGCAPVDEERGHKRRRTSNTPLSVFCPASDLQQALLHPNARPAQLGGMPWTHVTLSTAPEQDHTAWDAWTGAGSWLAVGRVPKRLRADPAQFETLWALRPADFGKVVMMGREVATPRWHQSYGRGYYFTGMQHAALPVPEPVRPILDWANALGLGHFNQVLFNWYANGHHYIGRHRDDETQLVRRSPILSLSFGATRTFRVRDWRTGKVALDLPLPDGAALVMGGSMQATHQHEVPKIGGKKGEAVGRRINITLRQFVDGGEASGGGQAK